MKDGQQNSLPGELDEEPVGKSIHDVGDTESSSLDPQVYLVWRRAQSSCGLLPNGSGICSAELSVKVYGTIEQAISVGNDLDGFLRALSKDTPGGLIGKPGIGRYASTVGGLKRCPEIATEKVLLDLARSKVSGISALEKLPVRKTRTKSQGQSATRSKKPGDNASSPKRKGSRRSKGTTTSR